MLVTPGINIVLCCFVARPVHGVGILLPGLVPAALLLWDRQDGDARGRAAAKAIVAWRDEVKGALIAVTFILYGEAALAVTRCFLKGLARAKP